MNKIRNHDFFTNPKAWQRLSMSTRYKWSSFKTKSHDICFIHSCTGVCSRFQNKEYVAKMLSGHGTEKYPSILRFLTYIWWYGGCMQTFKIREGKLNQRLYIGDALPIVFISALDSIVRTDLILYLWICICFVNYWIKLSNLVNLYPFC